MRPAASKGGRDALLAGARSCTCARFSRVPKPRLFQLRLQPSQRFWGVVGLAEANTAVAALWCLGSVVLYAAASKGSVVRRSSGAPLTKGAAMVTARGESRHPSFLF